MSVGFNAGGAVICALAAKLDASIASDTASFNAFVKNYGKSPLAPSAYYWIGNSQFALKDYRAAIATQRQLVAAFPGNPRVPDALLNIATSQFELGEGADPLAYLASHGLLAS